MNDWRPTASLTTIRQRASLLAQIRSFFAERGLIEVDVPVLGRFGVTDVHIDCVEVSGGGLSGYLQSSPEYFMKRLLAAGSGPIYYLGKAFRRGEAGSRHSTEFTLLEWYRPDWRELQLMDEIVRLVQTLFDGRPLPVARISYGELFETVTGLNPHRAGLEQLRALASNVADRDWRGESRGDCLDLIFSLAVEPALPAGLAFVHDYPFCQAALATIDTDGSGQQVARRFEAFLDGMELANGYCELADPVELRRRFTQDIAQRQRAGKPSMAIDENLLAAMEHGLPDCSGVALGIDRLLMRLANKHTIDQVLTFTEYRN